MNSRIKLMAQAQLLHDIGISLQTQHNYMDLQMELNLKRQLTTLDPTRWTPDVIHTLQRMPSVIAWWQQHWAAADAAFLEWIEDHPTIMDCPNKLVREYMNWQVRAQSHTRLHSTVWDSYRKYITLWNCVLLDSDVEIMQY